MARHDATPAAMKNSNRDGRSRRFLIRSSPVHGRGVFAATWIEQGERIIEYIGERMTEEQADSRYADEDEDEPHHTFLFALDDGTVIDASYGGNTSRFINHCCDPNCEAVEYDGRVFIEAIRDIAPGEELSYDYAFVLDEPHTATVKKRYPCRCGAPGCRGTILARKRR